jgi:hypothetical protein
VRRGFFNIPSYKDLNWLNNEIHIGNEIQFVSSEEYVLRALEKGTIIDYSLCSEQEAEEEDDDDY